MPIKILLGGSPCAYWSIAQTKNRETEPSGLGWDKYAIQIAQSNYPDIIYHRDAYQVRNDSFELRGDI